MGCDQLSLFPKDPFFNAAARKADGWTIVDLGWRNEPYEFYEQRCYMNFRDMVDWCNEHVGKGRKAWIVVDTHEWCFKDSSRALMFKLRWGGAS